jgi:hypothetical protein
MGPTPLLDFFKRGEAAHDVRMLAAQGALAPRAHEQLAILVFLTGDPDPAVCSAAENTLRRIPGDLLAAFLARADAPTELREFFASRGISPGGIAAAEAHLPLIEVPESQDDSGGERGDQNREAIMQQIQKMGFTERLRAAMKGSREVRAILVRDTNKMIAAAVLSSPRLTESEVESIARMANVSEDVLRIIASNRVWMKNYAIVVGLTKNPKTPIATSLNLMPRLNDRDLSMLSVDRNVPEPLRVAARKRVVAGKDKR